MLWQAMYSVVLVHCVQWLMFFVFYDTFAQPKFVKYLFLQVTQKEGAL